MTPIIAIDPGKKGGIAYHDDEVTLIYEMPETDTEILKLFKDLFVDVIGAVVYLEKVHSMPGMGAPSVFTFGYGVGFLKGVLLTLGVPIIEVTPQKWMAALECGKKSGHANTAAWKTHLWQMSQQIYPSLKIRKDTADALLILEYARRDRSGN